MSMEPRKTFHQYATEESVSPGSVYSYFWLFLLRAEFVLAAIRLAEFCAAMRSNRISGDVVFEVPNHPVLTVLRIILTTRF